MPEQITLADGTTREVPTAEEHKALADKAAKADELEGLVKPDVRNMRKIIDDLTAKTKGYETKLKEKGEVIVDDTVVTPEKVAEIARRDREAGEAEKLNKKRDAALARLSGGDENKKKVLQEQYDRLTGGRTITDPDELDKLLDDAHYLANRNKNSSHSNPVHHVADEPFGKPDRKSSAGNLERGAELANAFGYRAKGDLNKLIKK